MADYYQQYRNAIAATSGGTPPPPDLGGVAMPIVDAYAQSQLGNWKTAGLAQGLEAETDRDLENRKIAQQNAEREAEARQRAEEAMNDPSKYQKVRKEDGGFDFYDPFGRQINAHTFALKTGKRHADILKDSENDLDKQFIQHWEQVEELAKVRIRRDDAAEQKLYKKYGIDKERQKVLKSMPVDQLTDEFRKAYPNVFTSPQQGRGRIGFSPLHGEAPAKKQSFWDKARTAVGGFLGNALGD